MSSYEELKAPLKAEIRKIMEEERQVENEAPQVVPNSFHMVFQGYKRRICSGVTGIIKKDEKGGDYVEICGFILTGVIPPNVYRMICKFNIPLEPNVHLPSQIRFGLAPWILTITNKVSLHHFLLLKNVRDSLLRNFSARDAANFSQINKASNSILTCPEVDKTFWKDTLRRDFDSEKVLIAVAHNQQFYKVYADEQRRSIAMHKKAMTPRKPRKSHDYQRPPVKKEHNVQLSTIQSLADMLMPLQTKPKAPIPVLETPPQVVPGLDLSNFMMMPPNAVLPNPEFPLLNPQPLQINQELLDILCPPNTLNPPANPGNPLDDIMMPFTPYWSKIRMDKLIKDFLNAQTNNLPSGP